MVQDADIVKPGRTVWKNISLPKLRGEDISVNHLLASTAYEPIELNLDEVMF